MVGTNHNSRGLGTLLGRIGRLAVEGFQNRIELLVVEWQEERLKVAGLVMRAVAFVFLAGMGFLLLTATIIFLCPMGARVYVTGGLALLYLLGAAGVWIGLKQGLRREPFADSIDQVKKDRLWVESLK